MLLLFDHSTKSSERLLKLANYHPEHCRTLHEFAGFKPDLVLLDEAMTPEIAKELIDWGIEVCILAERVTVALRRKFPMVKDMVTDGKLLAYLSDYFQLNEEENEVGQGVSDSVNESAATIPLTMTKMKKSPISSSQTSLANSPSPPVMVPPRQEPRPAFNRAAKVVGFVSLRSWSGSAGKTGVMFNYAAYATSHGKKVIVVDLDPGGPLGSLAEATQELNMEHWGNLMRQRQNELMTERAVLDNVERQQRYGFYMIPSSKTSASMIEKEQFRWMLSQIKPYFDVVIFDLPATWTSTTFEMMRNADELFLFGLYDHHQYEAYKRTIEQITNPLNVGMTRDRLHTFLGRAYLGKNKDVELEEVKRQLNLEKVVLIPEDRLFFEYRDESKAIVIEHPKAESAKALIPWLESQMSDDAATAHVPALYEPKRNTKSGFLTRLFRGNKSKAGRTVSR